MPSVERVLREEIARLSRREVRKLTEVTRRATAQHRHHIAMLNQRISQLERQLARVVKHGANRTPLLDDSGNSANDTKVRFVAKGLRSHRARLGLSATDFGKLVGVSANSVYSWEGGKTVPRREQLVRIAAVRGIGKREANRRLEELARPTPARRR